MELPTEDWGERLKSIKPGVKDIFYKGNIDLLLNKAPKLAVVGSRHITDYGKRMIERWVSVIAGRGVTVISGFMYGVDQAAHKACIGSDGKTIAVLGWGIDRAPAEADKELYEKILESDGLIVSEYAGDMMGNRATFPQRNRIVAGLADAVWVVEGAVRSGSMITARLALSQGKLLLALPGRVDVSVAGGVNDLIKAGRAIMTTDVDDLFGALGMKPGQMKLDLDSFTDPLLTALESGPKSADELVKIFKIPVEELVRVLSLKTLTGEISEVNGKFQL